MSDQAVVNHLNIVAFRDSPFSSGSVRSKKYELCNSSPFELSYFSTTPTLQ